MISLREMMDYLANLNFDIPEFLSQEYRVFSKSIYRYRKQNFEIGIIKPQSFTGEMLKYQIEDGHIIIVPDTYDWYKIYQSMDETSFILSYSNFIPIRELMTERKDVFDVFMEISNGKFY